MTLSEFSAITRRVIDRDGFDQFLPTACFPARKHVTLLEGVPPDADLEVAAVKWATGKVQSNEEVLVAFKISESEFKIWRQIERRNECAVFAVS